MVIVLPPCQPSSAHLQGWVFHRLSEQPLPVPFPSHNDCFSCPIRNSLAQVVSAASHSHSSLGKVFPLSPAGRCGQQEAALMQVPVWVVQDLSHQLQVFAEHQEMPLGVSCGSQLLSSAISPRLLLTLSPTCPGSRACPQQCPSHSCQSHSLADYSSTLMVQPVFHSSSKSIHPSHLSPVWL